MTVTAFADDRVLCSGDLAEVTRLLDGRDALVIDDETGRVVDIDPRGPQAPRPRGRPKLGVAAREVTLLPRHWDWLSRQRGGASAALRRLVEDALRAEVGGPDPRVARDACYRAATTLAGDRPGYEEAMRALYAGRADDLAARVGEWPPGIAAYILRLAAPSS